MIALQEAVNEKSLRAAAGCFATGVTIVTTVGSDGVPHGITCNSFSSLSLAPPLVIWSVRNQARAAQLYRSVEYFAVNILAADQRSLCARFSSPVADRFSDLEYDCGRFGCPILAGVAASLECRVESLRPGGDHTIVVGEVLHIADSDRPPLIYWRGRFIDSDVSRQMPHSPLGHPDLMFWA